MKCVLRDDAKTLCMDSLVLCVRSGCVIELRNTQPPARCMLLDGARKFNRLVELTLGREDNGH